MIYFNDFAFGFKWVFIQNGMRRDGKDHIVKKTPNLYFIPTHQYRNVGPLNLADRNYLGRAHYKWVKPTERMRIRMETSGFVSGMIKWFNKNWDSMELKNGAVYNYYSGKFVLKRYEGDHPEILHDHHWKEVEDVRRI